MCQAILAHLAGESPAAAVVLSASHDAESCVDVDNKSNVFFKKLKKPQPACQTASGVVDLVHNKADVAYHIK